MSASPDFFSGIRLTGRLLIAPALMALTALPFCLVERDAVALAAYGTPINALFEGMSGITSCGLTLAARPDLLPASLQWWRSLCEWVGGVGVVVSMLLLLDPAEHHDAFYRAEARTWQLDAPIRQTAMPSRSRPWRSCFWAPSTSGPTTGSSTVSRAGGAPHSCDGFWDFWSQEGWRPWAYARSSPSTRQPCRFIVLMWFGRLEIISALLLLFLPWRR